MERDHPTLISTERFRETQYILRNPIVLALLPTSLLTVSLLLVGLWHKTGDNTLLWALLGVVAFEVTLGATLRLDTVVTDEHLSLRFTPFYRRRIPLDQVTLAEPVRYNPLGDAGGWGIRSSRKFGRVLNAFGDAGVRLHDEGGARLLVGSQRSDELTAAILAGAPIAAAAAGTTDAPEHPAAAGAR